MMGGVLQEAFVLEELSDTPVGKIAGGISAFAGAVFFYRASSRVFTWMFSTHVSGFFGWLVTGALAAGLLWLSMKLWSRWRLVFGAALAFFTIWSVVHMIPRIEESVAHFGDDRFGFVHTTAIYTNAIVLLVVAVVALFADRILALWKPRVEQRNSALRGRVP
jgi:hypothetical protein